ncbi:MAG: outer membrane protein assembly factor BamB family protein [Myxococcaceae bacterium]
MSIRPAGVIVLIVTLGACSAPVDRQFSFSTDAPSRTGLTALATGVLVGNEAGKLFHLGPGGTVVWEASLTQELVARPVAVGETAVAGTIAGELVGFGLEDGKERWRVTDLPPIWAPLVTDGERVFVLGGDGSSRAFDPHSGALLWSHATVGVAPSANQPTPAIAMEDLLVFAYAESGVVALRAADGSSVWRNALPGVIGLSRDHAGLYAATSTGRVVGLSHEGKEQWRVELKLPLTAGPFLALGKIWVGAEVLIGLEANKEVWRGALPGPLLAPPASSGELLLAPIASRRGQLVIFRPPATTPVTTVELDSPLRTQPLVMEDDVLVSALDGRVVGLRLKSKKK